MSNQDAVPTGQPVAGQDPGAQDRELEGATILIVDDNAQNVELLQAYLEVLPCQTVTARDGIEAMKLFENRSNPLPDLILLDVMMPRMSGFEVCRKIKEDPYTRSIPVIMVTALNELGDIERGVECGIDDFLSKPVNKLELITRVKSLLRIRHMKRELDRTVAYLREVDPGQTRQDHASGQDGVNIDEPGVGPGPVA